MLWLWKEQKPEIWALIPILNEGNLSLGYFTYGFWTSVPSFEKRGRLCGLHCFCCLLRGTVRPSGGTQQDGCEGRRAAVASLSSWLSFCSGSGTLGMWPCGLLWQQKLMEKDKASSACQFKRTIVSLRDKTGAVGRPCLSSFQHTRRYPGLLPRLGTVWWGHPVTVKEIIQGGDLSVGQCKAFC